MTYLITDRKQCGDARLVRLIDRAIGAGIDLIQIREKDLSARDLLFLARRTVRRARGTHTLVLLNDRFDIALSCDADGVHLPATSLPVDLVKRITRGKLLVGVSTHSLSDVQRAQQKGADYVLFGPVFETASKRRYGPPLGLGALSDVVSQCGIPVFALGGVRLSNFREALDRGARGIAAISLFLNSHDLKRDIQTIKQDKRRED